MVYAGQQEERTPPATDAAKYTVSYHLELLSALFFIIIYTLQRARKRFGAKIYNA